jgi:hypothetical protein
MGADGMVWRKASRSHDDGDACLEIASTPDVVILRDSKAPNGAKLIMGRQDFRRFTDALKDT